LQVGVVLDADQGEIVFLRNGVEQGRARGIRGRLYPFVSFDSEQDQITLIGGRPRQAARRGQGGWDAQQLAGWLAGWQGCTALHWSALLCNCSAIALQLCSVGRYLP
jgi:hypothetical protein